MLSNKDFDANLNPLPAMVSYNVIVGDTVTLLLLRATSLDPSSLLARREVVTLATTIMVTLPLSLYK